MSQQAEGCALPHGLGEHLNPPMLRSTAASEPVTDMSPDSLRKAMPYTMRNLSERGLKVGGTPMGGMAPSCSAP